MADVLTVGEIESRYKSEWILVEDPQTNEALEVLSGKVRFHSKDRDEVYRKAVELRPKRFAMLCTGTIPKDTAIVLRVSPSCCASAHFARALDVA
jgi:hypothetical protein